MISKIWKYKILVNSISFGTISDKKYLIIIKDKKWNSLDWFRFLFAFTQINVNQTIEAHFD
jgi:hypothetical protein